MTLKREQGQGVHVTCEGKERDDTRKGSCMHIESEQPLIDSQVGIRINFCTCIDSKMDKDKFLITQLFILIT